MIFFANQIKYNMLHAVVSYLIKHFLLSIPYIKNTNWFLKPFNTLATRVLLCLKSLARRVVPTGGVWGVEHPPPNNCSCGQFQVNPGRFAEEIQVNEH
jgi:hypothetical protein